MTAYAKALNWGSRRSLTDMIGHYASQPLGYEPGTDWQYSVATDLQAAIVERLTGERFDLFMKRRVFEPSICTTPPSCSARPKRERPRARPHGRSCYRSDARNRAR